MKKIQRILVLIVSIILLYACAKPTVVNVVLPGDEELNCEQLEVAVVESQKIKREAEYAKEGTGGNITRVMLFWPAWAKTLHNADVAVRAADDRIFHLFKIMKKKSCTNVNKIEAQILNVENVKITITQQLKELKKMYKSGDLTKEEYKKAKKKILD
jgi:chromosome segregation ATPase|tara:strand:+ start:3401 stop:3871 length:471 start_codon:yes stop_codon:yes gene_type:complete